MSKVNYPIRVSPSPIWLASLWDEEIWTIKGSLEKRPCEGTDKAAISKQRRNQISEETKSADDMFGRKIILKLELFMELYY